MAQVPPRSPPSPPPVPGTTSGLAYGGAAITFAFAGALATRTAWALCFNPKPRTVCEIALIVASLCQFISLIITGYLTTIAFLPPPPPVPQFLMRTATNWAHMIAVVLATYICFKRAQAIWVVAPRTAKLVAPILSAAMVGAAVSARVAGTMSEINALNRAQDPPGLFSTQQFLRALVNFTAAGFALFSEGYVTSIIVRFRRRSNDDRRQSMASRKGAWRHFFVLPTSSADRMRLAYALLICLTFLAQAGLQIAVMMRLTRFAPFHAMGWSLILIRITEFRSELLASVLVQQPGGGLGGGGSSSHGPSVASSSATSRSGSFFSSAVVQGGNKAREIGIRSSRSYMLFPPAGGGTGNRGSIASLAAASSAAAIATGLHRSRSSPGNVNVASKPQCAVDSCSSTWSPASASTVGGARTDADIPLARSIPGPPPLQHRQLPVGHDPRRVSTAPGEVFSYYTMAVASVVGTTGPLI